MHSRHRGRLHADEGAGPSAAVAPSGVRRRARGLAFVLVAVSSLLAAACGGDHGLGAPASAATGGEDGDGGWTILQYAIGDTDLEPFIIRDVAEMGLVDAATGAASGAEGSEGSEGSDDLEIEALVDRAAGYSDSGVLGVDDWQGARVLELGGGGADVVEDLGAVNTGDPALLADFVADGVQRHPSSRYALIISDHGASWPGVGGDESAGRDPLQVAEMRMAIAQGLQRGGVDKLDLLGFDACLMATYEVASNLAPVADRMVASEELEPGHGWDYGALDVVADDPGAGPDELGREIIDRFADQAEDEGTESDITLSLLDLTRMPALDEAVASFSRALGDDVEQVAPVVGSERARALGFGRSPDPAQDTQMTDLGLLAQDIGDRADSVSDEADAVVSALGDVVVGSVRGDATSDATGLSIYFPPQASLYSPAYDAVSPGGAWSGFLARYYATGASIPEAERPRFAEGDGRADASFDDDGLLLRGTFDTGAVDNLAGATMAYGIDEADGSVTLLGEQPAEVGEREIEGRYDLTALTISDGDETAFAYLDLGTRSADADDAGGDLSTVDVPLRYYASSADVAAGRGREVVLSLGVDGDGRVVDQTFYALDEALGSYGELVPGRRGMVFPLVPTIGSDGSHGWTATTALGLHADPRDLTYELAPVPAGTPLYAHLALTDYAQNTATLPTRVATP